MLGLGKLFRDDGALERAGAATEMDTDGPDTVILDEHGQEAAVDLAPPAGTPSGA